MHFLFYFRNFACSFSIVLLKINKNKTIVGVFHINIHFISLSQSILFYFAKTQRKKKKRISFTFPSVVLTVSIAYNKYKGLWLQFTQFTCCFLFALRILIVSCFSCKKGLFLMRALFSLIALKFCLHKH